MYRPRYRMAGITGLPLRVAREEPGYIADVCHRAVRPENQKRFTAVL
jgi:hypothetical protein